MVNLVQHSIDVILQNQSESGAYIACPNMDDYAYSWFRDGTFIAYAMDLMGEHDSAHRFYNWCAQVINEREQIVKRAVRKVTEGEPLTAADYLHTRYTLDGQDGTDEWPNFQLDGFGTWLWGVNEHLKLVPDSTPSAAWQSAAELVAQYLIALWPLPNYDCWEEFADKIHPYTLAAIFGGLNGYAEFAARPQARETADEIRSFIMEEAVHNGCFVKYLGTDLVDASLLGLAIPYGVVTPDHPLMKNTVERIERDLRAEKQGVKRYKEDSYYGGGDWLLLTAWLGWYYTNRGEFNKGRVLLRWIEAQAESGGDMPEQVALDLITPQYLEKWIEWRGAIATPLLWSHAMYLILQHRLTVSV